MVINEPIYVKSPENVKRMVELKAPWNKLSTKYQKQVSTANNTVNMDY
jgi:hypothetical protein